MTDLYFTVRRCRLHRYGPCDCKQKAKARYCHASAVKRASLSMLTFEQFWGWYQQHMGDRCPCGEPATTVDHIVPLAKGGEHSLDNLQRLCLSCNSRKFSWVGNEPRVYLTPKQFLERVSSKRL